MKAKKENQPREREREITTRFTEHVFHISCLAARIHWRKTCNIIMNIMQYLFEKENSTEPTFFSFPPFLIHLTELK